MWFPKTQDADTRQRRSYEISQPSVGEISRTLNKVGAAQKLLGGGLRLTRRPEADSGVPLSPAISMGPVVHNVKVGAGCSLSNVLGAPWTDSCPGRAFKLRFTSALDGVVFRDSPRFANRRCC